MELHELRSRYVGSNERQPQFTRAVAWDISGCRRLAFASTDAILCRGVFSTKFVSHVHECSPHPTCGVRLFCHEVGDYRSFDNCIRQVIDALPDILLSTIALQKRILKSF